MANVVIEEFESFNPLRYSDPWVAPVDPATAWPDFGRRVGGYTGARGSGEAGKLYVSDPEEGAVYMYGQKDRRGRNTIKRYARWDGEAFVPMTKAEVLGL